MGGAMLVADTFVGVHPPQLALDHPELMASILQNQKGLLELSKRLNEKAE